MFEFAASEFDSLMHGHPKFRLVTADALVAGGSLVLGVDELQYTDGRLTVTFVGSSAVMQLRIVRNQNKKNEEVLLDSKFTDFGAVREAIGEYIA